MVSCRKKSIQSLFDNGIAYSVAGKSSNVGAGFSGDDLIFGPPQSLGPFDFAVDPEVCPVQESVEDIQGNVKIE